MLTNFLKVAFRNLWRNKIQSLILIGGLTAGMATCILLLQYISFELSFDQFHSQKDRIFRVVNERFQQGKSVQKGTITYPTIGPTLKEEYPEVKAYTRLAYSNDLLMNFGDKIEPVSPGIYADQYFFSVFDFDLLASEANVILEEPNQIVLTKSLADRYFPKYKNNYQAIIGEELMVDRYEDPFRVVGVCQDVPTNSILQFDILASYSTTIRYWGEGAGNSWTWSDFYHYLVLEDGVDPQAFERKLEDFSDRHFRGTEVSGSKEVFTLQALSDAHLYSNELEYEIGQVANGRAVWSLLIIAFFILIIAWINYVNLSSVRAIERSREVGVRKVVGATRFQLMRQFFMEATLVNVLSLGLALVVVQILTPWFAQNFDIEASAFSFFQGHHLNIYLLLALLALIGGGILLSGAYPAWLLSSTRISAVLKGVFSKKVGSGNLRKALVIFQFTVSIALITATWLVSRQIAYMNKQDLGLNIDQIVTVNPPELSGFDSTFIDRMNTLKTELNRHPSIKMAATSSRAPGDRMGRIFQIRKAGEEEGQTYTSNFLNVDYNYATTYGLEPLEGRFFRKEDHSYDFQNLDKVVVNEEAAKMFGLSANEALGKQLFMGGKNWEIIGVMPNFHQLSLHHVIEPIIFFPFYDNSHLISLRIEAGNIEESLAYIESTYKGMFPGNTFYYEFLDERFAQLYAADRRFGNILSFFTILTILIACMGLFGLASYMTFLRTKEIGIRKVLGASTWSIVQLLSKDFLRMVLLAFVVAVPISYLVMKEWLQNFAYRVEMPWWLFLLAGIFAILIAFATVSFQSLKVAWSNPANSLRNE